MEKKTCTKCGEILPLDMFYKRKASKDGYDSACKLCKKEYKDMYYKANKMNVLEHNKKYYEKNKEELLIKQKEYALKNKEKLAQSHRKYRNCKREEIKIKKKKYYKDNKETMDKNMRNYYEQNSEKLKEYQRQYRKDNKVICGILRNRYRAKKLQLPNNLTSRQWEEIKKHFNFECAYCGAKLPLTQEHFIPLSRGGEFTLNNIIPACKSCNCSKSDKDFFKWYPEHKHYSKQRELKILKYLGYKEDAQQLKIM